MFEGMIPGTFAGFIAAFCVCTAKGGFPLGYLLFYPFRQILVFLRKNVKKVWINIGKTIANRRKKMYNISKGKCVIKQAEGGFLAEDAFFGEDKRSSV